MNGQSDVNGQPPVQPMAVAQPPVHGAESDKRLDRLFDYTKFHISLCLSAVGAMVTLIGSAGSSATVQEVIGSPKALGAALLTMIIAAIAGGVIASSSVTCRSFDEFWSNTQGPYMLRWFTGRTWAAIEHTGFWLSVVLIACSILNKSSVLHWLVS